MKITEFSLRNPLIVAALMAALLAFGLSSYLSMGVGTVPDISFPFVEITTTDAGGPLAVVHDRQTGLVVAPEAAAIAQAAAWLRDHPTDAATFGRSGKELAVAVTWDHAIERLLS